MALSFGQTGIVNRPEDGASESEYLECVNEAGFSVRMHLDAVDGIAHDCVEGVKSLPKRGAEIGGLLLGNSVRGVTTTVTVERYQRLECEHRFGPQFALDASEVETMEKVASSLSLNDDLSVIGFYRSNTRPAFQLEPSDLAIINRYFPDPGDLALIIQPMNNREIRARFFTRRASLEWELAGEEFGFRGRVVGPLTLAEPDPEPEVVIAPPPPPSSVPVPGPPPAERLRRLVPDFLPAGEPTRLAPKPIAESPSLPSRPPVAPEEHQQATRKWWPLAGALLLVGGALALLWQSQQGSARETPSVSPQSESAASIRPLGLYVDPSGESWRISWNANATALQRARNVAVFVREGEDQNRIDLSPQDLQSGTYQYQPKPGAGPARDITFRIEVIDSAGHLSAESFRLMRTGVAASSGAAPMPAPTAAVNSPAPAPPRAAAVSRPRAVKKVAPVVPASIRPRIRGTLPIDVRVLIDENGRVTSAVPVTPAHNGLETLLAGRAVAAAKQWRFEPVAGREIIHFVFQH